MNLIFYCLWTAILRLSFASENYNNGAARKPRKIQIVYIKVPLALRKSSFKEETNSGTTAYNDKNINSGVVYASTLPGTTSYPPGYGSSQEQTTGPSKAPVHSGPSGPPPGKYSQQEGQDQGESDGETDGDDSLEGLAKAIGLNSVDDYGEQASGPENGHSNGYGSQNGGVRKPSVSHEVAPVNNGGFIPMYPKAPVANGKGPVDNRNVGNKRQRLNHGNANRGNNGPNYRVNERPGNQFGNHQQVIKGMSPPPYGAPINQPLGDFDEFLGSFPPFTGGPATGFNIEGSNEFLENKPKKSLKALLPQFMSGGYGMFKKRRNKKQPNFSETYANLMMSANTFDGVGMNMGPFGPFSSGLNSFEGSMMRENVMSPFEATNNFGPYNMMSMGQKVADGIGFVGPSNLDGESAGGFKGIKNKLASLFTSKLSSFTGGNLGGLLGIVGL